MRVTSVVSWVILIRESDAASLIVIGDGRGVDKSFRELAREVEIKLRSAPLSMRTVVATLLSLALKSSLVSAEVSDVLG